MKPYKIGYISGFFDILHDGHIRILKWAKSQCEVLIVAVGTDEFMIQRKNHRSVLSYKQRVEIIKSIQYVDRVVEETNLDKLAEYEKYKFNVMFAGSDHEKEPVYVKAASELKKFGVDTIYYKRSGTSSTELRLKASRVSV